ncbi:MAG: HlyC/CorC family transporter [Hellea sp.]|nr:HlyC/CorC family transporter [Hellea sp.]
MIEILTNPEVFTKLLAVFGLLVISAFFSGSETALTAASRARIHAAERDGSKAARIVARLLERRERLIGALLLGNNLVNILASSLMTGLMFSLMGGDDMAILIATVIMTVLILIFAEVLPKTYAITRPDEASLMVSRPVNIIVALFAPVVAAVQVIVNAVLRLFGVNSDASPWTAADEIRGAVDLHHQEGGVAKRARDQIIGVLELGDLTVQEVMVHRKNMIMIDGAQPSEQILKDVLASGHSRLPVFMDDQDNVVGILHAKDMLKALSRTDGEVGGLNIRRICRDPWFVPETTSVVKQLRAFQQKREHFAIVVDEYGALMGVITLEDILEEIVGDIQDEYDDELPGLQRNSDGSITILGDIPIRDLNRALDWKLPDEEAVTIAGLVIHESQTIPEQNQTFAYYGYRFEVVERQRNQIKKLKITKTHEPDQRSD